MRQLLHNYFEGRLSRRGFLRQLAATGFTAAAARSIVDAADGEVPAARDDHQPNVVTGTGGELLVEQVQAAGTQFVFTNPGSFEVGFFDALTDRSNLQVIVGLHEGIVIPMADGYHKVTRRTAFVNVHAIGGTAQMAGQLYNAHRDGSAIYLPNPGNDTIRRKIAGHDVRKQRIFDERIRVEQKRQRSGVKQTRGKVTFD